MLNGIDLIVNSVLYNYGGAAAHSTRWEDKDDIKQEMRAHLWSRWVSAKPTEKSSLFCFLFTCGKHLLISRARFKKRPQEVGGEYWLHSLKAPDIPITTGMELASFLDKLSGEEARIARLIAVGYTLREVGEILGGETKGWVHFRLTRIRTKLRRHMGDAYRYAE